MKYKDKRLKGLRARGSEERWVLSFILESYIFVHNLRSKKNKDERIRYLIYYISSSILSFKSGYMWRE